RLVQSSQALRYLAAIFTHSRFLTEEVLQHIDWMEELVEGSLEDPITPDHLRLQLDVALPLGLPQPLELAKFRRRQILRIALRDILGIAALAELTGELSDLADTLIEAAYDRIQRDMVRKHGMPLSRNGKESHFAVIALGKLGGSELNYSSDI